MDPTGERCARHARGQAWGPSWKGTVNGEGGGGAGARPTGVPTDTRPQISPGADGLASSTQLGT